MIPIASGSYFSSPFSRYLRSATTSDSYNSTFNLSSKDAYRQSSSYPRHFTMGSCDEDNRPTIVKSTANLCAMVGVVACAAAMLLGLKLISRPRRTPLIEFLLLSNSMAFGVICYFMTELLAHTTLDRLPNTCAAMIDLAGSKEAGPSYPCQRDLAVIWYNRVVKTGHLNLESLNRIMWVRLVYAYVLLVLLFWCSWQCGKMKTRRSIRLEDEKNEAGLNEKSFRGDKVSISDDKFLV